MPALTKPYPVGRRIVGIGELDHQALDALGWHHSPVVLQLDDGGILWPSRDDEGNNAGVLCLQDSKGPSTYLYPGQPVPSKTVKQLVGRTIERLHRVGYGWSREAPMLILDSGAWVIPQADEEGNDGGAFFGSDSRGDFVLPTRPAHERLRR